MRHLLLISLLLSVGGCSAASPEPQTTLDAAHPSNSDAPTAPAASSSHAQGFSSSSNTLSIEPISSVPSAPQARPAQADSFCHQAQPAANEASSAARAVLDAGWQVFDEHSLGEYQLITVFTQGSNATSSTCLLEDSQTLVFRNATPVARIYTPSTANDASPPGRLLATFQDNRIRINDGTPIAVPLADVVLSGSDLHLEPAPAIERWCDTLDIPYRHGQLIEQWRDEIMQRGWQPSEQPADDYLAPSVISLRERMPEIADCAGTGYGFCTLQYQHPSGAMMHATSFSDIPMQLVAFHVTCPARAN